MHNWQSSEDQPEDIEDIILDLTAYDSQKPNRTSSRRQVLDKIATKPQPESKVRRQTKLNNSALYRRPLDIQVDLQQVPEDQILPPPRNVQGINGEE